MKNILLFFVVTLLSFNAIGRTLVVTHIAPESENDQRREYYLSVLQLALEKTRDKDGDFRLQPRSERMYQKRAFFELAAERLDVVWSMTSIEREEHNLPIRIPLLKGLLGHRIFLIRKGDQYRFSLIKSLQELKQLIAGQGHDWPDTKILEANGFTVSKGTSYEGLFSMLEHKRFDYFPRGVQEPWQELIAFQKNNLVVEKKLMLRYPGPIYFFVNKKNLKLKDRIERGLRLAIDDGSFDKLLYHHPITQEMFAKAHIGKRKVFTLLNPLLSPESKRILEEKKLWYQIGDEQLVE